LQPVISKTTIKKYKRVTKAAYYKNGFRVFLLALQPLWALASDFSVL
jgi:hypothetical protein